MKTIRIRKKLGKFKDRVRKGAVQVDHVIELQWFTTFPPISKYCQQPEDDLLKRFINGKWNAKTIPTYLNQKKKTLTYKLITGDQQLEEWEFLFEMIYDAVDKWMKSDFLLYSKKELIIIYMWLIAIDDVFQDFDDYDLWLQDRLLVGLGSEIYEIAAHSAADSTPNRFELERYIDALLQTEQQLTFPKYETSQSVRQ